MSYKYTDAYEGTLELKNLPVLEAVSVRVCSDDVLVSALVPYTEVRGLAEALLASSGLGSYVIPQTGINTVDCGRGWIGCGSESKSYAEAYESWDPESLLAKAANLVTIAKEIQSRRDLAAAELALVLRRDMITKELAGNTTAVYAYASDLAKNAIDLVIKMQDEKEEKND